MDNGAWRAGPHAPEDQLYSPCALLPTNSWSFSTHPRSVSARTALMHDKEQTALRAQLPPAY